MKRKQKSSTRIATIVDVAREAGVSPRTVSRVVNEDSYVSKHTYQRVQAVIERLGYIPNQAARSLVRDRNNIIGLIIPDIRSTYFAEVISGVEHVAQEAGRNVVLLNTAGQSVRERDALRIMEEHRADGVIFNTPSISDHELKTLLARQRAAVVIGHDPIGDEAGTVNIDIATAMHNAVRYMVAAGRRNIAYIKMPDNALYPHRQRYDAFVKALAECDVPFNPDYIVSCETTWRGSCEGAKQLLQAQPEVNAIIGYHDVTAFGVMEACDDLGLKVPDDVAVIGFDNITYSGLGRLSLTTFNIPRFEVGVQAARMLLGRMNGVTEPSVITIGTEFVPRGSTPPIDMTEENCTKLDAR